MARHQVAKVSFQASPRVHAAGQERSVTTGGILVVCPPSHEVDPAKEAGASANCNATFPDEVNCFVVLGELGSLTIKSPLWSASCAVLHCRGTEPKQAELPMAMSGFDY